MRGLGGSRLVPVLLRMMPRDARWPSRQALVLCPCDGWG
nr:MAG TPA: hypothetical protein [Caudoviricetes sp.]